MPTPAATEFPGKCRGVNAEDRSDRRLDLRAGVFAATESPRRLGDETFEQSVVTALPLTRIEIERDANGVLQSNIARQLPTTPRSLESPTTPRTPSTRRT